jgi:hypothetical protein
MIRFTCNCTHEFLVSEDQAGGMIQCPKCRRLNDIPLLSDLQNLDDDGTFKMDTSPRTPTKNMLPTATRAFTNDLRDEQGNDIDLRPSVSEFLKIGTGHEVPIDPSEHVHPDAPKYDPVTGELVEEIDIKPSETPIGREAKKIPMARRAVSYADPDLNRRATPATILMHLGLPVNLFVMLFVVLAHVLMQATIAIVAAGIFFIAPVLLMIAWLLVAHYGVIIEEIATGDADELPRPLRNVSFVDDIWNPFIRFCFAILFCFWPVIFQEYMVGPVGAAFLLTCILFGLYFFPAVLMTSLIGGSYLNIRPDRIVGVIRACGRGYLASVIAFTIGGAVYLSGIGLVCFGFLKLFEKASEKPAAMLGMGIGSPTLLLGIYLFHFACWHLGLLYRANHDRFPWILQRHTHSRRTDTLAQLEAARKAARRHDALRRNKADREQRLNEIREAEKAKRAATGEKPIWDRVAEPHND